MTLKDKLISQGFDNAELIIRSGKVRVNNEVVFLPLVKIKETDKILIEQQKEFVSRGAYKLLAAIKEFDLNFQDKVVLDVGSSTGGFTQVCLLNGAKTVYALDSGTNQLDYSLRIQKNIKVMEKTNIKNVNPTFFKEQIDSIVCDVSFISLNYVVPIAASLLKPKSDFVVLFKPQFEASSKYVEKGGYVDLQYHDFLINRFLNFAKENFNFIGKIESPITGKKSKNTEYIIYFQKNE